MSVSLRDVAVRVAARERAFFGERDRMLLSESAPLLIGTGLNLDDLNKFSSVVTRTAMSMIVAGEDPETVVASIVSEAVLVGIEFAHMEAADVEASVAE